MMVNRFLEKARSAARELEGPSKSYSIERPPVVSRHYHATTTTYGGVPVALVLYNLPSDTGDSVLDCRIKDKGEIVHLD